MKIRLLRPTLFAVLLCGVSTASLLAQGPGGPSPGNDGPPPPRHGPPPNLLFDALDTNHDGVISAEEIANASASLKSLLKNGATQLTREDVRPPRPTGRGEDRARDGQSNANTQNGPGNGPQARHHGPPDEEQGPDGSPNADQAQHSHHHGPPPDGDRGPEGSPGADQAQHPRHHGPPEGDRGPDDASGPQGSPGGNEAANPRHHGPPPQDGPGQQNGSPAPQGSPGGDQAQRPHHGPPPNLLFDALDTNHDGVISAEEIANASASLKSLLKNGATQLTREDVRPPRPTGRGEDQARHRPEEN